MYCIGFMLNWLALAWIELNCIDSTWLEWNCVEVDWSGLGVGLDVGWLELDWIRSGLNWNWIYLNRISQSL